MVSNDLTWRGWLVGSQFVNHLLWRGWSVGSQFDDLFGNLLLIAMI